MTNPAKQPKDFGFGNDEMALRDVAAKFLADNLPTHTLHQMVAADSAPEAGAGCHWDQALWNQIVGLGWLTIAIPEHAGGLGMSAVAVSALVEQAGQAALPGPLLSTLSASYVLSHCETDHAASAMRCIADGEAASLATCNQFGSWDPNATALSFEDNRLSGVAWFVQDLQKVKHLLVAATRQAETVLIWLPVDAFGITTQADNIIDLTRDQGRVTFDNVEIAEHQVVAGPGKAGRAITDSTPSLLVLVSADICGAAEWQLQTTSEYARTRKQFDHNIGFFQAVKHPLVEFMVALDLARSHLYNAACAIDHEPDNALAYARMAKAAANDAAAFGSKKSVQLHGGIGFTWECFVHIYLKRQLHSQMLLGDASYQRAKLAEMLVDDVET
jgi:alkylation response protein AidB-like acyl-CoA dehydrogenase